MWLVCHSDKLAQGVYDRAHSMPRAVSTQMSEFRWAEELEVAVTAADRHGTIVYMNRRAKEVFTSSGGGDLVGKSLFDCHPGDSQAKLRALYDGQRANHYTIRKRGQNKIIHQLPRLEGGVFNGYVEISVPIPDELPHFDRG